MTAPHRDPRARAIASGRRLSRPPIARPEGESESDALASRVRKIQNFKNRFLHF